MVFHVDFTRNHPGQSSDYPLNSYVLFLICYHDVRNAIVPTMLAKLNLENFKNFKDAELHLGPFTLLVGENASGKSNIRDALRFLHGIARGYNVAEVFGEVWAEGGVLQWKGIRGGMREAAFMDEPSFSIGVSFINLSQPEYPTINLENAEIDYALGIKVENNKSTSNLIFESMSISKKSESLFDDILLGEEESQSKHLNNAFIYRAKQVLVNLYLDKSEIFLKSLAKSLNSNKETIIVNFFNELENNTELYTILQLASDMNSILKSIRFFDFNPDAMRSPSFPGQAILGDRGENLSSVLYEICQDEQQKAILVSWLKKLTPMDVVDLDFVFEYSGKVLLLLVEESGEKISAYSASDGTLRFLGFLAAMLNPKEANKIAFFEELENGIHPTRLYLLVQLIEQTAAKNNTQVIATTHSPQLLRMLNEDSLESASLVYRLPDRKDARIKRIVDIPDARRAIDNEDLGRLQESGWLEDAVYFTEPDAEEDED